MGWDNNTFPKIDNPNDVGWLISYWRIMPCTSCNDDYRLDSRQFDHLVKSATKEEALAKFNEYVAAKRRTGKLSSIKGLTLFLSKIESVVCISDNTGEMI